MGVFDLESPQLEWFTERHIKVLMPLASQVAGAIVNARLYDEIRRNEHRLGRELRIARDIQHALFPRPARRGPAGRPRPTSARRGKWGATSTTSTTWAAGCWVWRPEDVSGKGVPAALYAAFVSGNVRRRAFEQLPPAELLERVNGTLRHRGIEGLFCTLAYALFDFPGRTLRVANSGLPYPLHYRAEKRAGRAAHGFWPAPGDVRRGELRRDLGGPGRGRRVRVFQRRGLRGAPRPRGVRGHAPPPGPRDGTGSCRPGSWGIS